MNPNHLFLGTQADNLRDMFAKGRHPSHGQKLSDEDVRAIRRDDRTCDALAALHGVSRSTIWLVKRRKTYSRVT